MLSFTAVMSPVYPGCALTSTLFRTILVHGNVNIHNIKNVWWVYICIFLCVFEHNYQIWCFYLLLSIVNMNFYLKTVVTRGHFEKCPPYWKVLIPLQFPHFSGYNCTKFHVSITYYLLLMWNLISKQAVTGGHLENGRHIETLSCSHI